MRRRPARPSFRLHLKQKSIALFLVTLLLIGGWDFVEGRAALQIPQESRLAQLRTESQPEGVAAIEPQTIEVRLDENSDAINDGYYQKNHTFTGRAGQAIEIELTSEEFAIYLALLDPSGNEIAVDNDTDLQIAITLPRTGTYTIIVISFVGEKTGSYRLTIRAASQDDLDLASQNDLDLAEADRLYQQVLQLIEQERYDEALPLAQQTFDIQERILGSNHFDDAERIDRLLNVAERIDNLSEIYRGQGDFVQAEALFRRALSVYATSSGRTQLNSPSLDALSQLYRQQGSNASEEEVYSLRALAIMEVMVGTDHGILALPLDDSAETYQSQGNIDQAEQYYQRSLAIREATQGSDSPLVATNLDNLALLQQQQGNYAEAEELFQRSLAIRESVLGVNHPFVAVSLDNLAQLYQVQGNMERAEPLSQRASAIREVSPLDVTDPEVYFNAILGGLYYTQGDLTLVLQDLNELTELQEADFTRALFVGSEAQKLAYVTLLQSTTNAVISLHLQPALASPAATRLELTTVLRRKGRVLDALTDELQRLRQNLTPADQLLLDQLQATNTQLSNLIFSGLIRRSPEEYQARFNELEAQATSLSDELDERSAEFRLGTKSVTIEAVQAFVPADAALVEFVRYRPFDFVRTTGQRWGNPRYAAYVLNKTGDPQVVDLGEAEAIDQLIAQFRANLRDVRSGDRVRRAGRELDAVVMQPIRSLLGDKTHILISPDGQLNLIPFAALVDEGDRYLLESYTFTYLTSGRDLLKLQLDNPSGQAPVLFANPDYENPGDVQIAAIASNRSASSGDRGTSQRSSDITELQFAALPGTQTEADAIAPLLPRVTVLTRTQATENTLKRLQSPSILHFATHGFFLEDVEFVPLSSRGDGTIVALPTGDRPAANPNRRQSNENPLLRSGLALAGFNPRQGGGAEDGVLTALEVTNLDLRGTELVVMSACETGIGDVVNGEGVYGLRRAFVMAGAESQLMSLWKVDDFATSELMSRYYQRLQQGETRSQALRQVQQAMLEAPAYRHPYYWSSFIFSGDWRVLST